MFDMITSQQIQTAIDRDEFLFHYQPKISLITGQVAGAEALIRWRQRSGVWVSPSEFIPIAAASPLITAITSHMFSRLLTDLTAFNGNRQTPSCPVSFNVSARDLEDDSFVTTMVDALERSGIPSDEIEIELTENEALTGGEHLMHNLRLLEEAGISLTMDDYGIGHSSIDSLSVWPFSTIKLDQGMIGRMLTSTKNAKIVQSSIRMAHELNLKVVAEGVESQEQYDFLMDSGCQLYRAISSANPFPWIDLPNSSATTRAGSDFRSAWCIWHSSTISSGAASWYSAWSIWHSVPQAVPGACKALTRSNPVPSANLESGTTKTTLCIANTPSFRHSRPRTASCTRLRQG
jgi:EAL domain-containing protein (putative c-di-GMP-specific phosphodiesterase class I)